MTAFDLHLNSSTTFDRTRQEVYSAVRGFVANSTPVWLAIIKNDFYIPDFPSWPWSAAL
jgi:hypothetical protein